MPNVTCPRCKSSDIQKDGSIIAARGRVQRYRCVDCAKKFHPSLKDQPIVEKQGYWDIENSQVGRGAGNFGVIFCWCIRDRETHVTVGDCLRHRSLSEEKRVVKSMITEMRRYDRLFTWYGTNHDVPISRTRAEFHGLDFPTYQELLHTDLYYSFRYKFKLHSNKQDNAANFFGMPDQPSPLTPAIWVKMLLGGKKEFDEAMEFIFEHCSEDVEQTQWIHERIEKYMAGTRRTI